MPQGMKPRDRRVKMATKPIRKAFKKITEGMMISPKALQTGPRRIKTDGRITKEDMKKYMQMKPREYKTGISGLTKGLMQARPLPMTPEMIKKMKDGKVPNPRAQQRDRSKPIIGKPMRRSSARKK